MRRMKIPLTVFLALLVLADAVVGVHLWNSGWPKRVSLSEAGSGTAEIHVIPIHFTGTDWLFLVMAIAFHAALLFLVWKAWRSSPVHV
jgi:hypothetical protein